jgi:hypothetical protein
MTRTVTAGTDAHTVVSRTDITHISRLFRTGHRQEALAHLRSILPRGNPLSALIARFEHEVAILVNAWKRVRARKPRPTWRPRGDRPTVAGLCKACGGPRREHGRRGAVQRRHMWIINQRRVAQRDWATYSPEAKKRRMEPAWAARRAKKTEQLVQTVHPRLQRLLGASEVKKRLGRVYPT